MSQIPRLVVLDDRDSRIIYSNGDWLPDNGSRDPYGNFGATYLGTQQSTSVNGSLSFSFAGTGVWIYGSIAQKKLNNDTYDPLWDCYLDNTKIKPGANFVYPENNWLLCGADSFNEGDHQLTLNVSTSQRNTFYIDYVEYRPTAKDDPLLDNVVRLVDGGDKSYLNYSGTGWNISSGLGITQTDGASVQFSFNGTGFTWVGQIPSGSPTTPATLSYTIDGGSPTALDVKALPYAKAPTHYSEVIFTTPQLSRGTHDCIVTYHGNTTTGPLGLTHILLNSTLINSSRSSSSTSHKHPFTGAIVGGVIGGVLLVALILTLVFLLRKHQLAQRRRSNMMSIESPTSVNPFSAPFNPRSIREVGKPSYNVISDEHASGPSALGSSSDYNTAIALTSPLRPLRKGTNNVTQSRESDREAIHHHDSGIRLQMDGRRSPIEIPPVYSPS